MSSYGDVTAEQAHSALLERFQLCWGKGGYGCPAYATHERDSNHCDVWCDECAPPGSPELPYAEVVRWLMREAGR